MSPPQEKPARDGRDRLTPDTDIVPVPWIARRKRARARETNAPRAQGQDPDDYLISTRTLVAVSVFIVLLIVVSVWLMETMRVNARLEECLMSGRKNCMPISVPPAR
jgi:hypothetical protein